MGHGSRSSSTRTWQKRRGWLHSLFHSRREYYNPITSSSARCAWSTTTGSTRTAVRHASHDNMEIISYVVDGQLTHRDNLGNGSRLERGDVQYMSAGSGIMHSEYNDTNEPLRFLQIWICLTRRTRSRTMATTASTGRTAWGSGCPSPRARRVSRYPDPSGYEGARRRQSARTRRCTTTSTRRGKPTSSRSRAKAW